MKKFMSLLFVMMLLCVTGCGKRISFEEISRTDAGGKEQGFYYTEQDDSITLVVQRGEFPSGGYGIKVKSVEGDESHIYVTVEEINPGPGDLVTLAFTYPQASYRIYIKPREVIVRNENGVEYPRLDVSEITLDK